jgi:predicted Zn finger-like uncharacterized protein
MIVECGNCQARYTIADALVPPQGARVRCKKCATVIAVKPPAVEPTIPAPTETTLVPAAPEPAPQVVAPPQPAAPAAPPPPVPEPAFTTSIFEAQSGLGSPAAAPAPAAPAPAASAPAPAPRIAAPAPPPAAAAPHPVAASAPSTIPTGTPIPEGLSPEERQKHERARRLARVLASDVAIYNREKRERGMQDGNIVAVLGYEIKKSWETYKERVGIDFANATPYFRDALNEIVAEGKKIF